MGRKTSHGAKSAIESIPSQPTAYSIFKSLQALCRQHTEKWSHPIDIKEWNLRKMRTWLDTNGASYQKVRCLNSKTLAPLTTINLQLLTKIRYPANKGKESTRVRAFSFKFKFKTPLDWLSTHRHGQLNWSLKSLLALIRWRRIKIRNRQKQSYLRKRRIKVKRPYPLCRRGEMPFNAANPAPRVSAGCSSWNSFWARGRACNKIRIIA